MPDRRQTDRRASSNAPKKISISLSSFIFIVIIFTLIITSIFLCSYISAISYNEGYTQGYDDCYFLTSESSYDYFE